MRHATGVVASILLCVLLAGCLDSIVSPPADGGAKRRPLTPPPYAGADGPGDGLDPLRWAVDPVTEEARYLGNEGTGGALHREASRVEPHRTGHCGGEPADPRWANAIGTANGIHVKSSLVVEVELDYGELGVRQSGPGATSDERRLLHVRVPDPTGQYDHIVSAVIVAMEGESVVNASALESSQHMVAQIADLSVLDGTVRADLLRAEGSTRATPRHAEWSTSGSVMAGVSVADEHNVSIHPWFHVDLSDVFGPGSYVSFFEAWGHVHTPVKPIDGFAADVGITMVRVVLADVNPASPTTERVDVAVARVWSHSDFPEDPGCRMKQGLEGHAYNLHVTHPLPAQPVTLGLVDLPTLGGNESQHLAQVDIGTNTVGAAMTRVWGDVPRDRSWARGMAEAAEVCLLESASGACAVEASLVRVSTLAVVTHDGTMRTEADTVIADLRVLGQEVCPALDAEGLCRPEPNTVLEYRGLRIVLNAQSDVPVQLPECQTGIRVRGIDVQVLSDQARVIVSESQSGAFYCPVLLQ